MHRIGSAIHRVALVLCLLALAIAPAAVLAQNAASAGMTGNVTDQSGGALPNVKVTLTSPQLQVPQLTTVTDEAGIYKFLDLPAPGVYSVSFTAPGFQTQAHEGVNLGVGFTAKIDASMQVGAVSQTVQVTGASPVIDTVATSSSSTLQETEIQDSPKGVGVQELLAMSTGVSLQGKPDVGDSNLAARSAVVTYGVPLVPTLDFDGINTQTDKASDTAVYLDSFAISEAEEKTVGNNADVAFPGVDEVIVMKSGSNTFHGSARGDYENPSFQGSNTTLAALGQPLSGSGYYDYAADLGGRAITDKLWGYGGYSKQSVIQGSPSFVGGPGTVGSNGCTVLNAWQITSCPTAKPATITTSLPQYNFKVSYQLKPSTKLIFSRLYGNKYLSANGAGPLEPLPYVMDEQQPDSSWHGEVQSAISSRLLLDALFGHGGYHTTYTTAPASLISGFGYTKGSDFAGSPSQEELSSKLFTGPDDFPQNRPQNRWEMRANVSFIPSQPHLGGTHQLKIGTVNDWEIAGTRVETDKPSGDYLLEFSFPAGGNPNLVTGYPNRIQVFNYPFPNSINHLYSQSGFIIDTWTIKRVSLNIGVRGEHYDSYIPSQVKVAGQFSNLFPAQTFPMQDILSWVDVVPRAGAVWDVRGNGKTVIKGSFGLFGDTMGDLFSNTFNPDAQQSSTYNWPGPCQATAALAPVQYQCDVTAAFLATLPSLKPVAQTGGTSQVLNPGLKQDKTYEYSAAFERQIIPNVKFTATYVNYHIYDLYTAATNSGNTTATVQFLNNGIAVGHPLSSYTIPVTVNDTFNGVAETHTIYTYPSTSGNNTNDVINNPSSRPDVFQTIEFGVTKQYSKKWTGFASFWATKDHRWINGLAGIQGSPNDNFYPIDSTWNWEGLGNIAYNLPWGFQVLSFYRAQSGTPGERSVVASTGTYAGTTPVVNGTTTVNPGQTIPLSQGSTTFYVGPYGQYRGPVYGTWNVKAAKTFKIKERWNIEGNFQIFNILNSNAAVTTNYQTGASTFGVASSIISPRVARIGGVFSF
jgi:Carboxypeptidase regulatory-like domain